MKMKNLLATALILLMSMMACVPAFAEGWDYTITATIDCTVFTKNETGNGWSWDSAKQTLTITHNLLIKITQVKGDTTYGIKLPDGATLNIINGKRLLVGFVPDGESGYGIGYGVYSTGEITINGNLETVREGGDIFAVCAPTVKLSDGAQINAYSCGGVVTPNLEVCGNNTILADRWCIDNNDVSIYGSGTLTLNCADTPIRCNSYTVAPGVTLKFNPIPVSEEKRITPTIPGSLKGGIQVTHDAGEGKMTVSIGEMSSDAWAAAIREALKASPSGEISSIGFDVKVTPPDGATKMMYSKGNITDEEFSKKVLDPNSAWGAPSEVAVDLATVAKDGNGDYTVTPKQDSECIYIAWKNNEDKVIRVEKLNVVVDSTSAAPITVSKEQVAKPAEKPSSGGSGSGSSVWYRGGNSLGASIPSDPTEVLIDGVSVPFTVDGNTITVPSLTDGRHNVQVIWRGGSYSFNITASGTVKSVVALPKTGDSSMGPYVGLCMLVFMGMLAGGAVLNRKKAK